MAWNPCFALDVVTDFRSYWSKHWIDEEIYGVHDSLHLYIKDWLYEDTETVMQLTGSKFSHWLEVVLILIDAYEKDPSILDFESNDNRPERPPCDRRVERILDLDEWGAPFIDSHEFYRLAAGGQ